MSYPGLRLGNILYFALRAYRQRSIGGDYWILDPGGLSDVWATFPRLQGLTLQQDAVRYWDEREYIPRLFYQEWGIDFTRADLRAFIADTLLSSEALARFKDRRTTPDLTINVRRGDYYASEANRYMYGFDVPSYLRVSMEEASRLLGPLHSVEVVSDDPQWCIANLSWLEQGCGDVTFVGPESDAIDNLFRLATARNLVLANSTFSYWGAYVNGVLNGRGTGEVWVPAFHSRVVRAGNAWQHDPRWRRVETLP